MADLNVVFWLRRTQGVLRYLLRQTPHPALLRYTPVRLDPAAIRRSVEAGQAFALPLQGRHADILVKASPVHAPDARIIIDGDEEGDERPVPAIVTFAGSVLGEDDSDVRLTITTRTITGYVRIGEQLNWIDPLSMFHRSADPTQFVVYRAHDLVARARLGGDVRRAPAVPGRLQAARRIESIRTSHSLFGQTPPSARRRRGQVWTGGRLKPHM